MRVTNCEVPRVIYFNAAHSLSEVFEAVEVRNRNMVDTLVNEPFYGLHNKWHTAVGHSSVNLGVTVPWDLNPRVTHDRHDLHTTAIRRNMGHHNRIGTAAKIIKNRC